MAEAAAKTETVDEGGPAAIAAREGNLQGYLESLVITIILAVFGTTFIVQAFKIPSASMYPGLQVGDYLLVNKFIFGGDAAWYDKFLPYRAIHRQDGVVFKYPFEDHPYYVKRVIGLPGDRIRIANERVYVNDKLLDEPYVVHDLSHADPYMFDFPPKELYVIESEIRPEWTAELRKDVRDGELIVPAEQYFVMGDNRDNSADSRYWGFVPRDAIVGRPLIIYWSLDEDTDDSNSRSLAKELEDIGRAILYIPTRTRWSRMFREVH
ncbi:MAG TPA: signal peptidase I [Candidatus Acidoferrales bacterium]|nr:signal peptidase I [Candidatus Acidoferrales bacterium]